MNRLLKYLTELERRKIHYSLEHNRFDSIMILVAVPGQRWEIEFFTDGHVETEILRSAGIAGEETLERLFDKFGD